MTRRLSTRGFSLIEVLIALLVFSIGLIGLAGLMVVSVKTNHSAFLRSQASFLAQSMVDRMRANMIGVWQKSYDDTYPVSASTPCASACSWTDLVTRDQVMWSQELNSLLPNAAAIIACTGTTVTATSPQVTQRAPYDGTCTITMTWSESNLNRSAPGTPTPVNTPNTQQFAWVFQP